MTKTESHETWLEGRKLSAEAASALESSLAANPNDVLADSCTTKISSASFNVFIQD